jgi:hypothetical protein
LPEKEKGSSNGRVRGREGCGVNSAPFPATVRLLPPALAARDTLPQWESGCLPL